MTKMYAYYFNLYALAIDTLVAQAFTGSSNPHTVGTILQRGLLIVNLFGVLVAFLW